MTQEQEKTLEEITRAGTLVAQAGDILQELEINSAKQIEAILLIKAGFDAIASLSARYFFACGYNVDTPEAAELLRAKLGEAFDKAIRQHNLTIKE